METIKLEHKELKKAKSRIQKIDLKMVRKKLMDRSEGHAWTKAYCDDIEALYREFLIMVYLYPKKPIVPTKEIDIFWHNHILDTKAYSEDCKKVFGKFIHHNPYAGMQSKADLKKLDEAFKETKMIYFQLFGRDYASIAAICKKCSVLQ